MGLSQQLNEPDQELLGYHMATEERLLIADELVDQRGVSTKHHGRDFEQYFALESHEKEIRRQYEIVLRLNIYGEPNAQFLQPSQPRFQDCTC